MEKIKVYSTPTCVKCKQARRLLDKMGADYDYIDVTTDEAALAHIRELGFSNVPVLEKGDTIVHGFRPTEIRALA